MLTKLEILNTYIEIYLANFIIKSLKFSLNAIIFLEKNLIKALNYI